MTGPTILAVDDDMVQRRLIQATLTRYGYNVILATNGEEALEIIQSSHDHQISAILLDLLMPGIDGLSVLKQLNANGIKIPVVVQTSKGGIDTVISAMRAGAFDFVVKPVAPEKLALVFENALKVEAKVEAVEGQKRQTRTKPSGNITFANIITAAPNMERVLNMGERAAHSAIPIMVEGESGVGKELVARAICSASDRSDKPFITVNCGAIPENLVESTLFGHEKGSFTGATDKHVGKFVEANGGTLFLDEIGDLPLDAQVKLLRAVQEGEVDAVGSKRSQKVDIRLISATHRDLVQAVKDGNFREDLYYRLNVFPIRVPPLRERRCDIALLVRHFIARVGDEDPSLRVRDISQEACDILTAYDWPGNIRQLENAVLRAVILCDGDTLTANEFPQIQAQLQGVDVQAIVRATHNHGCELDDGLAALHITKAPSLDPFEGGHDLLPQPLSYPPSVIDLLEHNGNLRTLSDVEREVIRFALEHYDGQMSKIARNLGIGRSTLYRKMKEMGLEIGDERSTPA